jgi:putative nucleotidyltransferase with HDIG domain
MGGAITPESLVAGVKDLVTLPDVALRISRMVDDPGSSAADIAGEIARDAALTGRLLRIANSPGFGQYGKIATLSRAITVLGVRQVRDLTVGLTAIRAFDGISNTLVTMESFWRHNLLCAVAAGQIAAHRGGRPGESAFVGGLLHDIGQLVIFSRAHDAAREALLMSIDASSDDLSLYQCERKVLGFDHCDVGVALARNWGLPPSLQACIEFHHEPDRATAFKLEVATVHVATAVAVLAEIGSTDPADAPPIAASAMQACGLDAALLARLAQDTRESAAPMLPLLAAA